MSKRRKGVNRPRDNGGRRTAQWVLLIAVVVLVGLVVLLSRLTAEHGSQPVPESPSGQTDARSVEKPPEKAPVSPEFEFYTLLPEQENRPPPRSTDESDPETPPHRTAPAADAQYLIQAGSFRRSEDAEARKAELALMGFQSRVQPADVDGVTYHRVVIGPLSGETVSEVRRRLEEEGVDTMSPRRVEG
ncbi:MAG: SPOR domain-containing protein [Pseudomonadota bacterium]